MQKMPYKHIAAHLKKTELACRLHYHQLSHGSHRRKRTGSMCSTSSNSSTGASPNCCHSPCDDENCSAHASRHNSPGYGLNTSPGRAQHKILLPKPGPVGMPNHDLTKGLRLNTSDSVLHPQGPVDTDRLHAIYEAKRASFWSSVAQDYGAELSPAQIEDLWRRGSTVQHPLTPDQSPCDDRNPNPFAQMKPQPYQAYASQSALERAKGYNPVHPIGNGCSPADRMPFMLPPPTPSSNNSSPVGRLARNNTWSNATGSGVSVASLLTDDRPPRPEYLSHRSFDDVRHYH